MKQAATVTEHLRHVPPKRRAALQRLRKTPATLVKRMVKARIEENNAKGPRKP